MADSARIGANFSDYEGNAGLGNVGLGVFNIDTRPLQQLAQYTFYYNRSKWDAEQKELEKMAKESAEFAQYDLTNAIPKYAKHVRDKFDEIFAWSQANPDVKSYSKNPKGYNEWRKKLNELGNDILDGASQEVINTVAKKAIEEAKSPEEKAELQRQLDEEIAAKDIRTPLTIHKYNAAPSKIPEIPIKTFDFTKRGANGLIVQRKFKAPDQGFIVSQAFLNANNMLGETSEDYSNMPEDVRKLKIKEAGMRKATGRNAEVDQAEIITQLLRDKSLRDENGKIDIEKVMASSNPIISGLIGGMLGYNKIMDEEETLIDQSAYSDNLGVLIPGVKGMRRSDYKKIDWSDGEVTAYDLLLVKYRGNAPVTTWETETKELNNDLQREGLAVQWYNARKKPAGSGSGGDVIDKPAILFGEHIDTAKKFFSSNPQAQNFTVKYAAVDPYTRAATGLQEGHFLTYKKDGSYVTSSDYDVTKDKTIGTIENFAQGMINAVKTIDKVVGSDKDGTMAEGFQIKSEAKFKELWGTSSGKYIWDNWGEPSKGEAKKSETKIEELDPNGFKKEGSLWRYKDGRYFNADGVEQF